MGLTAEQSSAGPMHQDRPQRQLRGLTQGAALFLQLVQHRLPRRCAGVAAALGAGLGGIAHGGGKGFELGV